MCDKQICTHMATSMVTQFSLQVKHRRKCCIKSQGCSDTAVWRLFLVKIKIKPMWKCYCHWMKLIWNSSRLSLALSLSQITPSSLPLHPLCSPLSSLFPPPPHSPASLSTSRSPSPLQASEKEKESPVELTERCFRELLGRAAYGNIKNAVTPVLM